jgi:hypothetical protein
LLEREPAATAALLDRLQDEVQNVIADIRRLVYQLRPPEPDELGLVTALREHTDRLTGIGPARPVYLDGLIVTVQAPQGAVPLPQRSRSPPIGSQPRRSPTLPDTHGP